jgi:hypothetical protein
MGYAGATLAHAVHNPQRRMRYLQRYEQQPRR